MRQPPLSRIHIAFLAFALAATGCSVFNPKPKLTVEEVARYSALSPQELANSADALFAEATKDELSFYSPQRFAEANSAMAEFKALIKTKSDQKQVIEQYAVLERSVNAGKANKEQVTNLLKDELQLHKNLQARNAHVNFKKEYDGVVSRLNDSIRYIEDGKSDKAIAQRKELNADMLALEVRAIKYNHLHIAEAALENAKDKGAEKSAPATYKEAAALYAQSEHQIGLTPYDDDVVAKAGLDATFAAKHVLNLTLAVQDFERRIKTSGEQLVLDIEARLNSIALNLKHADVRDLTLERQFAELAQAADKVASAAAPQPSAEVDRLSAAANVSDAARKQAEAELSKLREELAALKAKSEVPAAAESVPVAPALEAPLVTTAPDSSPAPAAGSAMP